MTSGGRSTATQSSVTPIKGKADVIRRLFGELAPLLETVGPFEIGNVLGEGDHVVVQAVGTGRTTKTGGDHNNDYCFVLTLRNGKITSVPLARRARSAWLTPTTTPAGLARETADQASRPDIRHPQAARCVERVSAGDSPTTATRESASRPPVNPTTLANAYGARDPGGTAASLSRLGAVGCRLAVSKLLHNDGRVGVGARPGPWDRNPMPAWCGCLCGVMHDEVVAVRPCLSDQ